MTKESFYDKWQEQHLPCIDSQNDNGFYYQTCQRLEEAMASQGSVAMAEHLFFSLLLFIEDEAGLGLTRTYRKEYKSAGDIVGVLLTQSKVSDAVCAAIRTIVDEAIKAAPESAVTEAVRLSMKEKNAQQFADIVCWLERKTKVLSLINPPYHVREERYFYMLDYPADPDVTLKMTYFDFAFNRDYKDSTWMTYHLADCFCQMRDGETVTLMDAVRARDFDFYTIDSMEDGYMILVSSGAMEISKVKSISPIPIDCREKCLGCQLLSIDGGETWMIPTAVCWKDEDFMCDFDQDDWLESIDMAEHNDTQDEEECGDHIEGIDKFEEVYGETWEEWEDYLDNEAWEDWAQGITDHYDGPRDFGMPDGLREALEKLMSTPEGEAYVIKRMLEGDNWEDNTDFLGFKSMPTKEFREMQGMRMPDYKKKPAGKYPDKFFQKKINAIGSWILRDDNDLKYALRAYEGWLKQAQQYLDEGNHDYCYHIASNLLWDGTVFYEENHNDYEKYTSRIRKLVGNSHALMMQAMPHIDTKLQEDAYSGLSDHRTANWAIYEGRSPFNLDASINELYSLLHPDKRK